MNRNFFSFLIVFLCNISCNSTHQNTYLQFTDYRIEKGAGSDSVLSQFLQPYTLSVNSSMNKVIGFTNNYLIAKQPESGLGNLMADCMKEMAEKKFGRKVDAGFMNQGGIRSYIPKGNITMGKVFELMPFDNLVVLQDVKGTVLQAFLNKTAADGGWPVSAGIRLGIKEKKAVAVMINGKPLDENAVYVIANSDYIANGGSDCDMLRSIPRQNKGYLFRDALIDYITEFSRQGKPVDSKVENRVTYVN